MARHAGSPDICPIELRTLDLVGEYIIALDDIGAAQSGDFRPNADWH
jgi:hypothetical protein